MATFMTFDVMTHFSQCVREYESIKLTCLTSSFQQALITSTCTLSGLLSTESMTHFICCFVFIGVNQESKTSQNGFGNCYQSLQNQS